jgi:two-component system KDP operon response regulator KdpE
MSLALARVLVIDDEPQIHRLLRSVLGVAGYSVERADTGIEGLRLARSRAPDAVLLDLGLPDISGHEVLARLRSFSGVPVIMLSARDSEADKVSALDNGADDYIVKPFGVGELLARIRVAMRHRRVEDGVADILHFRGLVVDISRRRATAEGKPAVLTAKEWTLLSLLARNAGRVLTHRQLLTAVWGPAHAENTQYLRVYVGLLRQKLGSAAGLIATETAVGYRMADYADCPATDLTAY